VKDKRRRKTVNFNLDQNETLVFDKNKKIIDDNGTEEPIVEEKKPLAAIECMDDLIARTMNKSAKKTKNEDIIQLSKSKAVATALLNSVQTPQTGSQFERDYKSFKGDQGGKLDYLLKTVASATVIKNIFKSSLETDILIDMVSCFGQALNPGGESSLALDIAEFLKSTSECWPFEMAVEFLSTSEKQAIRELLEKLENYEEKEECKQILKPIMNKLYQKFKVAK
jgi:hypothetical protein